MEEDFEENQKNLSNSFQEIEKNIEEKQNSKKRFLKFAFALFLIITIFSGTVFIYENYLNPKAKLAREQQKNYQKYLQTQANYEKAMKEDTYGGKTPEETLKLFIDSLKKEDFDLASKYFVLNYSGIVDPKYKEALIKAKNEGKIEQIIDLLSIAKPDPEPLSIKDNVWFVVYKKNSKEVEIDILFKLNPYTNIWKIESL